MSLIVTTDVQCDVDGCFNWIDGVTHPTLVRKQEARAIAAREGWTRYRDDQRRLLDCCPHHSKDK